ncbi:MAG: Coq4 family protein [Bacteroidia bacterium]
MILCNTKHFEYFLEWRERLFNFLTLELYFPFCKAVYSGKGEAITLKDLAEMPPGSLGNQTYFFLCQNKLEPMPGYEAHDMKHTLLGFAANMQGEICMQYFEFGNGNRSIPVITVMLFGTFFMPEKFNEYRHNYTRGKKARQLSRVDLKNYANQPLDQLKIQWNLC